MVVKEIRWDIDGMTIKKLKEFLNQFENTDEIDIEYEYGYDCEERYTVINIARRD